MLLREMVRKFERSRGGGGRGMKAKWTTKLRSMGLLETARDVEELEMAVLKPEKRMVSHIIENSDMCMIEYGGQLLNS